MSLNCLFSYRTAYSLGATIIVYTAAMRTHVEQAVRSADRGDLIVCQQDAPPAQSWS